MKALLKTNRLTLRALAKTDAVAITRWLCDFDVAKMLANPPFPYQLSDAHDFINGQMTLSSLPAGARTDYTYGIDMGEGIIGAISLTLTQRHSDSPDENSWELGYWLAKPFWGQAIVAEAGQALLAEFGRVFPGQDVRAGYFKENSRSGRVLEKLGFYDRGHMIELYCRPRQQMMTSYSLRANPPLEESLR